MYVFAWQGAEKCIEQSEACAQRHAHARLFTHAAKRPYFLVRRGALLYKVCSFWKFAPLHRRILIESTESNRGTDGATIGPLATSSQPSITEHLVFATHIESAPEHCVLADQ